MSIGPPIGQPGKRNPQIDSPPNTPTTNQTGGAAPAAGAPPAAAGGGAAPASVPADSFGSAPPAAGGSPKGGGPGVARPQGRRQVPGAGRAGAANPAAAAADLQRRVAAGQVTANDFQGATRGQAAEMVATLAKGSLDQRDNLMRLMTEPGFSQHLTTALNEMPSADRGRVLKSAGEATGRPDAGSIQSTLRSSIDGMVPSRRGEMLRDSLLEGDTAAMGSVNGYLSSDPAKASEFLRAATSDATLNDQKLATVFGNLDDASRREALRGLSSGDAGPARETFKRLGDATFDSQQDRLRGQLENGLNALPADARNALLNKVISDPSGNRATDQQVNKGQRLVAEYFERQGPQAVKSLLDSISPDLRANAPTFDHFDPAGSVRRLNEHVDRMRTDPAFQQRVATENFIRQNVRSEDVQRALDPAPSGSVDRGDVTKANDRADTLINTSWQGEIFEGRYASALKELNGAELDRHFDSLSVSDTSKLMNAFGRFGSPTDGDRIEVVDHVVSNGSAAAKAKLAAGLSDAFVKDPYYYDSDKTKAREEIGKLVKSDPNGVIREMAPSDLKNMFKASMHPPADMSELKSVLSDLTPQNAAKMAKAMKIAANEVAAEVQTGGALGDFLKGLTISGKMGRSSEVSGEVGIEGGKVGGKAGMSREIGFSWSPAALVDGNRKRELNQVTEQLNSFMMDWTAQLNRMSPNQKAGFLREMKDEVTLNMS